MGESFRDLLVWQRAIAATVKVYQLTSTFPADERFGLTAQLRRAAVSVASNVAEGYGRATTGEYLQFLGHARGSNGEIETQLVIARELGFGDRAKLSEAEEACGETGKLLRLLMKSLRAQTNPLVP